MKNVVDRLIPVQFDSTFVSGKNNIESVARYMFVSFQYNVFLKAMVRLMYDMVSIAGLNDTDLFGGGNMTCLVQIIMCEYYLWQFFMLFWH